MKLFIQRTIVLMGLLLNSVFIYPLLKRGIFIPTGGEVLVHGDIRRLWGINNDWATRVRKAFEVYKASSPHRPDANEQTVLIISVGADIFCVHQSSITYLPD